MEINGSEEDYPSPREETYKNLRGVSHNRVKSAAAHLIQKKWGYNALGGNITVQNFM